MNSSSHRWSRMMIACAEAAAIASGCATTPKRPPGSEEVRAKLTALQSDSQLAPLAPDALREAETAVKFAETPQPDKVLAQHRVYIADRKVETARALAEARSAEQERAALNQQMERVRLDARTREAEKARTEAQVAREESLRTRAEAEAARNEALAAQRAAGELQQQAAQLQEELALLQARPTDRGLVLTLGDTLFPTGKAELKPGATANLDRLKEFLAEYPERTAVIEGYTDSAGSEEFNQELSQRRADAVKRYLVERGVESARLQSAGRGESAPVADNDTAAGRQQNRRVEVIISEAPGR